MPLKADRINLAAVGPVSRRLGKAFSFTLSPELARVLPDLSIVRMEISCAGGPVLDLRDSWEGILLFLGDADVERLRAVVASDSPVTYVAALLLDTEVDPIEGGSSNEWVSGDPVNGLDLDAPDTLAPYGRVLRHRLGPVDDAIIGYNDSGDSPTYERRHFTDNFTTRTGALNAPLHAGRWHWHTGSDRTARGIVRVWRHL